MSSQTTTTTIYDENILEPHEEGIDPQLAMILSGVFLAVAFVSCCGVSVLWKDVLQSKSKWVRRSLLTSFSLWILAMVMFVIYAEDLQASDPIDYLGYMRISNVTYQERVDQRPRGKGSDYYWVTEAVFHLDWGYQWACPHVNNGQQSCQSTVTGCMVDICKRGVFEKSCGSEEQRAAALEESQDCVWQTTGYDDNITFTPYNPQVGPSNDADWPSITAYGDCHTCTSTNEIPSPLELFRYRTAGFILLAFSVVGFVIFAYLFRQDNDEEQSETMNLPMATAEKEVDDTNKQSAIQHPKEEQAPVVKSSYNNEDSNLQS